MKILISAGEASSDLYGAQLIVALRRRARVDDEPIDFFGVGGESMRAAGCETLVDARQLAVVGMTEILAHLPRIYSEFRKLLRAVDAMPKKPDLSVVVDSPAFNFRVAREMHARGIPVLYFVAPQLWAWREYRVKRVQRWIKKVLCIFPFEEEFYRKYGVEVEYIGHPLADLAEPAISRAQYAREYALDPEALWIALLPGSRKREVRAILPNLTRAAALLRKQLQAGYEFILPIASGLDPKWLQDQMKALEPGIKVVKDARAALHHSSAAAVTSGTATVEAALMGCPFVAVYKLSPITFWAARRLVKVPFAAMPNLVAGRQIVPELLQNDFTPERVAAELRAILEQRDTREQMIAGFAEVCESLRSKTGALQASAIERAADAILRTVPSTGTR